MFSNRYALERNDLVIMKAVPFLDNGHLTFGPAYFTFLLLVVKINRLALIGFQAQLDTLYDITDTL